MGEMVFPREESTNCLSSTKLSAIKANTQVSMTQTEHVVFWQHSLRIIQLLDGSSRLSLSVEKITEIYFLIKNQDKCSYSENSGHSWVV